MIGMVYEKMKILCITFFFFESAQKMSNFSENDIDIYLRLSRKYGAKLPSQKKVIRVQSWGDVFLAGDFIYVHFARMNSQEVVWIKAREGLE